MWDKVITKTTDLCVIIKKNISFLVNDYFYFVLYLSPKKSV